MADSESSVSTSTQPCRRPAHESQIFEQLRNNNDSAAWERRKMELEELQRRQLAASQALVAEQVSLPASRFVANVRLNLWVLQIAANSTLPVTVGSVSILGAQQTRQGFLQQVCAPLLKTGPDRPQTLSAVILESNATGDRLTRTGESTSRMFPLDPTDFQSGIFENAARPYLLRPDPTDAGSSPTDLNIEYRVKERPRMSLSTGTDVGHAEGAMYGHLAYRNLFGGAENLALHASLGTRTRSIYSGSLSAPLAGNPDLRLEAGGAASTTDCGWASHEERSKRGWTKLTWLTPGRHVHEFTAQGAWRRVTGLADGASPTVRGDAGHSVKNSITHAWTCERRDNPILSRVGYCLRTVSELALPLAGPLQGDVSFAKAEFEAQGGVPVPLPGVKFSRASLTTGLRAGLMVPLGRGPDGKPQASRINDRFQLGGPADVRGFRTGGLGPRDGQDAVGGDLYVAGSANLLLPVPGVGPEWPLRCQLFMNWGRLLGLSDAEDEKGPKRSVVPRNLRAAVAELGNGLPTTAAGIGLVYGHPMARFELNFTLPLISRRGENVRKGLQFGVGLEFL